MATGGAPPLPPGRTVELPGRGTTFVRELPGPPDAPTVVLLHGWTATADLNWYPSYAPLARSFRVIALDHRGHGQGIRSRRAFHLEDCADDVAALVEVMGLRRVVVVGYSMGGPIAMLAWRRHPALVDGLVLCATARNFNATGAGRWGFLAMGGLAVASRISPAQGRRWLRDQFMARRGRQYEDWAYEQAAANDWTAVFEAGRAIGAFSARGWIGDLDRPSAVVMTLHDRVVPPRRQLRLAESMPGAVLYRIAGDHSVCVGQPERFVPALVAACTNVAERAQVSAAM
jgi:3-oxoadipate enol-lactonase